MTKLTFIKIEDKNCLKEIQSLAISIWNEHYTPIIGSKQVAYMLDKFQSAEAIEMQIKNGYNYYLIQFGKDIVGYIGFELKMNELFLSKLYINSSSRGKGAGKKSIKFIESIAKQIKLNKITLTVNKNNINSIAAYKKFGFKIIDEIIVDIGDGYVMDDYIMEKSLL